jgi:CheY-like chemotaxis protein
LPLDPDRLEHPTSDLDGPLQGARVLVVDDNDTCRKVLVQQCSAWGMNVSAVPSGKEALALLRTKAHLRDYFDVVLLDQNMPGMTGMQLAAKIKEDPSLNHDILLIMLTGISNAPSKIIARNAGIKRILAKPVAGYTLKTTLADELAQRNKGLAVMQQPGSTAPLAAQRLPHSGGRRQQHLDQGHPRHARQAQPATGHRQQWRRSPAGDEGPAL